MGLDTFVPVKTVQDSATGAFRWMMRGASRKVWRLRLGQVRAGDAEFEEGSRS